MGPIEMLKRLLGKLIGRDVASAKETSQKKLEQFKDDMDEIELGIEKIQRRVLRLSDLADAARSDLDEAVAKHGTQHTRTMFAATQVQKLEDQALAARRQWQTLEDREKVVRKMIESLEIKRSRALPVTDDEIERIMMEAAIVIQEHEDLMETLDDSTRLVESLQNNQDSRFERVRDALVTTQTSKDSPPQETESSVSEKKEELPRDLE